MLFQDRRGDAVAELTIIGMMSGTSGDGVDAALIRTDGVRVSWHGPWLNLPYDQGLRAALAEAMQRAAVLAADAHRDAAIAALGRSLTLKHVEAVRQLLAEAGLKREDVDLIGFHGQTLFHKPAAGITVQIGDGALLARETGIDVVHDFRSADVAAGGQGAPLAPLYHQALALSDNISAPFAFLNLGGVGNLTWIDPAEGGQILAFDTGPGNGLIDDWCARHFGEACDRDGRHAARGQIDHDVLRRMLADPWLDLPPPKSLDRHNFDLTALATCTPDDGAATLTAFTAGTVAKAVRFLPSTPHEWMVCGGGRHNPVLMQMLARALSVPVFPVEVRGWRGDALEAEAFAYLAARSVLGLPLSLPETTGVSAAVTGGVLSPAF